MCSGEHSPGTPLALTADPNLVAVASSRYRYLLIHCILCEQQWQQSSASVALCDPDGPLDGVSPSVGAKSVRFGLAQNHSSSSAQLMPSLLAVVCCFPGCIVEMGHVALGLFVPWDVLLGGPVKYGLGPMSRRFCTTSGEILLLQGPCQPERASSGEGSADSAVSSPSY